MRTAVANESKERLAMMTAFDSFPKEWRLLIHEYGAAAVISVSQETDDAEEAADLLAAMRAARQAQR